MNLAVDHSALLVRIKVWDHDLLDLVRAAPLLL